MRKYSRVALAAKAATGVSRGRFNSSDSLPTASHSLTTWKGSKKPQLRNMEAPETADAIREELGMKSGVVGHGGSRRGGKSRV